jgi:hypothetical protein
MDMQATIDDGIEQALQLDSVRVLFKPHHLDAIGPRVFVVIDEPHIHTGMNLTADHARRLAERLIIAACQAEALERNAERRKKQLTE